MKNFKVGIVGFGNLGKGVLKAIKQNDDIDLVAIFTRRKPEEFKVEGVKFKHISEIADYKEEIDVMLLCGGSATDLPEQGPMIGEIFNTVDSFDTHANIPMYFSKMDKVCKKNDTLSLISVGWDPGLFSLNRLLYSVILPKGKEYTFWGTGVSQGHSDAIRRVIGVKKGIQYTIPKEEALKKVRSGVNPDLTTREKHERVCYVVPFDGADLKSIEKEIKEMPNYFSDYDTTVHFISDSEFDKNHNTMKHGGFVIRTGETGNGNKQRIEFSLELESNPEFTSNVLVSYARAINRLQREGKRGALTVFDIPFSYLTNKTSEELRRDML